MITSTAIASIVRRRGSVGIVGLLVAVSAAGCGSSNNNSGSSFPPDSTAGTSSTVTQSSSPAISAADVTEIKTAFMTFFSSKTSVADSVAAIQDGAAFKDTLEQQSKTDVAQSTSATVSKVVANSANSAAVMYTILQAGSPLLPNANGFAVREDGRWKVAGATFCGLLALQGARPPVCSQPAATSLPG